MTTIVERALSVPQESAWEILTVAQAQPERLNGTTAQSAPVVPARAPWTVSLTSDRTVHGYLHIVDLDADCHTATVSFTGTASGSATIIRTELTVSLTKTAPQTCSYRAHAPGDLEETTSTVATAVAQRIAETLETSTPHTPTPPSEPGRRSRNLLITATVAALIGAAAATGYTVRTSRNRRQAGDPR